ncbi:MAG: cytochrome-c peroxidase [Sulfurimonas sp. RIFCSPHIGHO2_12_FULL_36_9]|uniref:efflux RND transporter permease subunit n=1 Tax=Sulfurimonas sp. RIFCSPLOWO2_12_36_12 TaxID=1802253 RepID=UPI0008B1B716|nr:CusA/CzcA family heavy metal efflux RND transporter [Sulfurimonas sp. RIFCSPLOWO2_12_36_12]OHD96606.1 MAG: cytochrome-c peroxidase [Sulfurimonas sp. RIFCSPHIGHO2_12_FULL_36_9]OHD99311.1 MAG: cytochrome-c peroxidase [Sulfurimonas sp. RIFCSPLOWO2_02_FULL_36_28]OHE01254.1 MAG: cytochrome-c peroxidase [Sulfurimonas sp. RIFCSPLOWO2_12_36_12]
MMKGLISFSLTQRLFISLVAIVILGFGVKSYNNLPVDAFPDISPIQVKIIMKSSGMTPDEVESQIVIPIEMGMLGIPHQTMMRSTIKYGICDIAIDFEEGTDIYWARQQVNERLNDIADELPANLEGGLAPISTPLSEILMFTIESKTLDLSEKRSLLDWVIAPKIRSISGVAEVNALGGKVKTYEVTPKLEAMRSYGISLEQLIATLENSNINDGAGRVTQGVNSVLVRSVGRINDMFDIKNLSVALVGGKVITIGDLADVKIGYLTRAGFSTKNGQGETVQGIVLGLKGANTKKVLQEVNESLKEIESMLPKETKIDVFYDRSTLVDLATDTVKSSLFEAVILIVIVLLLLLGNFASALSVALILPFALLMSFIAMNYFGLSANLMSLGGLAIAVGILVDSAVVMVEHITAELGNPKRKNENKIHIIYNAAVEMAPSIVTGVLIIIIVFMPLLTLEGLEGKLFKPVALSIVFALFSSLILSLTLIPVLSSFILKIREDKESWLIRTLLKGFRPSLNLAIKHSSTVFVTVLLLFGGSLYLASKTGKAFMPTMDEGTLIAMIESLPSISLEESIELNKKIQTKLMSDVPEIASIIARTGTDELGLDPMSLNDTDTFFILKPMKEWRVQSKEWLKNQIRESLDDMVGVEYVFTQPIEMRVSEMLTGVRGDLAIDIFGDNHDELERVASEIKTVLEQVKGSSDVYKKSNEGIEYFELSFNQQALGYYGLNEREIATFMKTMVTGVQVGIVQEGMRRIKLMVKGEDIMHNSLSALESLYYVLKDGTSISLANLITFKKTTGPVQIEHENGYRKTVVQSNVQGRDLVGFVEDAKAQIEQKVQMPAGYYVTYGGEFENQQRAAKKLMIIVPIALFLIFILLFVSFNSITQALLVLINIPLALIGGFAGLYISGEYLSVPASVGFIALLGIAVLNGVVLVNYFNYLVQNGYKVIDAVREGTIKRFRPVLMTATIAAFGLLPLLFATGPGSEIQKPLAIVVINGLISSTILTLIVLPLLYLKFTKQDNLENK